MRKMFPLLTDFAGLAGCALVVAGVDWFSRGAALIVAGVLLLLPAVMLARKA